MKGAWRCITSPSALPAQMQAPLRRTTDTSALAW
eukprot:CAMPEP_0180218762 /NCGR_PEP_ID=MMETSP0987-20121128/17931_1 /TAXON_ID=697907 /ORGANISM="non described non described, Strain CCMP2293" /LENGTH=33 /DNA_ID= /DNA_START= /DNA_END= /DNA_ORIENTATION=